MNWPGFVDSPREIGAGLMAASSALGFGLGVRRGWLGRGYRGVLTSLAKIPMYSYQEAKADRATELLAWFTAENERLEAEGRRKDEEIARLRAGSLPASGGGLSAPLTSTSTPTPTPPTTR